MDKCCGTCKWYQSEEWTCLWRPNFKLSDAFGDFVNSDMTPEDGTHCPTYEPKEA